MKPSIEDIQWLRIIDLNVRGEVPEFNKSRLIAMGLISRQGDALKITEQGQSVLAANPRTASVGKT